MSPITYKVYVLLIEPMLRRWKERVTDHIRRTHGPALDVCCGIGSQCRLISRYAPVVGVDLDLTTLVYARRLSPTIPFVCADAAHLPFRENVFQSAVFSLALHDKPEPLRRRMIAELLPRLQPTGRIILLDFDRPQSVKSQIGYTLIWLIERLAGNEHFLNGREFVKRGGLTAFLQRSHLQIENIHRSDWGSISIQTARPV